MSLADLFCVFGFSSWNTLYENLAPKIKLLLHSFDAVSVREKTGKDSDEFGNTINPLYKEYCNGYIEYLNSHPEEQFKRNERLRKLGYPNV